MRSHHGSDDEGSRSIRSDSEISEESEVPTARYPFAATKRYLREQWEGELPSLDIDDMDLGYGHDLDFRTAHARCVNVIHYANVAHYRLGQIYYRCLRSGMTWRDICGIFGVAKAVAKKNYG